MDEEQNSLSMLPDDCLLEVFSYLDGMDLHALRCMNQRFHYVVAAKADQKTVWRPRKYRDFTLVQSATGHCCLVRQLVDDDYHYVYLCRDDGTEVTELTLMDSKLYKEATTFVFGKREMNTIPARILERMVELLNKLQQINNFHFINISLSYAFTNALRMILPRRKSLNFVHCNENFGAHPAPDSFLSNSFWLNNLTDSITIRNCYLARNFNAWLCMKMRTTNYGKIDDEWIMRDNITEKEYLMDNFWRFKCLEIDSKIFTSDWIKRFFEDRLRATGEPGRIKLFVTSRSRGYYQIFEEEGKFGARPRWKYGDNEFEVAISVEPQTHYIKCGLMKRRSDGRQVQFTMSKDGRRNVLIAHFKSENDTTDAVKKT